MPVIIAVVALVVIVGAGAWFFEKNQQTDTKGQEPAVERRVTHPGSPATEDTEYADGTYASTGTYRSPAGTETVDVSVTLKDDVIVAATFKGNATHPTSMLNQGKFSAGYTAAVVGKDIDDVALTIVNGSSLTPIGFMDALAKIKAEAKS